MRGRRLYHFVLTATSGAAIGLASPMLSAEPAANIAARPSAASASDPNEQDAPTVVVVGVTPVPGAEVPIERVPSAVRRVTGAEFQREHPTGLADAMNHRVGGVTINEAQGNPLQPDLSFRGFTISPLLGLPQGLAVYQNGTRLNEPFGDTVQWDVIPDFAIAEAVVLPGANPVYGLNALGGAIALRTKQGFDFEGARIQGLAGSFSRFHGVVESGGSRGPWGAYVGADVFGEEGFRDHSESTARRLFVDVSHRGRSHEVALTVTGAASKLRGNGPAPIELLQRRRSAIFTSPDITENAVVLFAVPAELTLSRNVALQANAYIRPAIQATLNGDEAELIACPEDPATLCEAEGDPLVDRDGVPVPSSFRTDAVNNTTRTVTTSWGGSLQTVIREHVGDRENQLTTGVSVDAARVRFTRRAELAVLEADRSVSGLGLLLGGAGFRTELEAESLAMGLYATDTFELFDELFLTASGRLNSIGIVLSDRLGTALDGRHQYVRLNPSLGVAYVLNRGTSVYAGYSEANRAPTAAEIGCADPDAPCRVPNALLSDPPLEQVVNRSVDAGMRGRTEIEERVSIQWAAGVFGSRNSDDILFVAGSRVGTGYFRNAGTTQRIGGEAEVRARVGAAQVFVAYELVRATFETALTLPGENHPNAGTTAGGERVVRVEPGDLMPNVPSHSAKVGLHVRITPKWRAGISSTIASSQYYRGDEANWLEPIPGYAVLDATTAYDVLPSVEVFVKAQNILNTEYETFGVLGDASGVLPTAEDARFLSPGAPFGLWAGASVRFD